MAKIGNFGRLIVFETSDKKVLTPNGLQRTIQGNWIAHERIGKKPKSEFLNPSLQTMQFTITLNVCHGIRPRNTMEEIERAVETGSVEILVIGGKKVGKNYWKITQCSEAWDTMLNGGELVKATLTISLEEYV